MINKILDHLEMTLEGGEEKDETIKEGQVEGRRSGTLCEQQGQSKMHAGSHTGKQASRQKTCRHTGKNSSHNVHKIYTASGSETQETIHSATKYFEGICAVCKHAGTQACTPTHTHQQVPGMHTTATVHIPY